MGVKTILIAVACNLIAVLVLVNGIITSAKNGWKVTLTKFIFLLGAITGAYFLTPVISNKILGIAYNGSTLATPLKASIGLGIINSLLFVAIFFIFYLFDLLICNIVKACLINSYKDEIQNKAKLKRARSINAKAEKVARKAQLNALKAKFAEENTWWKRLIAVLIGIVISVTVGMVVLMPYGFFAERLNKNANRAYLEKGYEYTLNGIIDKKHPTFFDKVIHNETSKTTKK